MGRRVKLADVRVRNPEDGYTGGVLLVAAALVPLLNGTLLKEGSADELAASSTADEWATDGAVELGLSSAGELFATEGLAVYTMRKLIFRSSTRSGTYDGDGHWSLSYCHSDRRRTGISGFDHTIISALGGLSLIGARALVWRFARWIRLQDDDAG